jgi:hypothetical protein
MSKKNGWGGIDPGVSGCLCLLTPGSIHFHDIVSDEKTAATLDQWHHEHNVKFMIEKQSLVRIPPKIKKSGEMGGGFVGGVKLIDSYAFIRGVLVALNCNWYGKTARQWHGIIPGKLTKQEILKAGDRGRAMKIRSREYAKRLYPAAGKALARVMDHDRAEALLMAHYVRETEL